MSAFASWAVVAASLMYWGLRLFAAPTTAPDYTVAVDQATRGDLARVFGTSAAPAPAVASAAPAPAPAQASKFKLVGVAAPRDAGTNFGLALISIDGKPARAVSVGRAVDEAWVLQSVSRQSARLSATSGAETMDLDVPPLALASRGVPGAVPPSASPGTPPPPGIPPPGIPLPGIPPPGTVRPPVVIPPGGAAAPSMVPAPGAPQAAPGSPPSIFVPQEELNRARSRAAGTGAAEE